jgi:hypothetical protein
MRAEHEIAGEASNHPSGQLNHLGVLDAGTTDAGAERTLWYRRRTVNADDQFDAAVNDQKRPAKEGPMTRLCRALEWTTDDGQGSSSPESAGKPARRSASGWPGHARSSNT